jgi:putative membrane-bound dehydrogenase-like protein
MEINKKILLVIPASYVRSRVVPLCALFAGYAKCNLRRTIPPLFLLFARLIDAAPVSIFDGKPLNNREITAGGARTDIRKPDKESAAFRLQPGFTAELVSSEEQGTTKPITVAWDRYGRMWSMTATEYPVDANENRAEAEALFARGGKDRLLVFDELEKQRPLTPRVFADTLAMPLGILPLSDCVIAQYGSEIRRYFDHDNDGKSDGHEVILEGFGVQDSHLFPHQFERAPGGWIYVAQGAFNKSQVRRPGGNKFADGSESVNFDHTRLGRFKPDGSAFEVVSRPRNNLWGLVQTRSGEVFAQEANDMGYPVSELPRGTHLPSTHGEPLREDAPILPTSTTGSLMGGTGLSGLALAEDAGSPFAEGYGGADVFYIANPITSRIQIVTMKRNESGHPVYEKKADFLVSEDPRFRPIAIHFGPDGFLYIVDWYNKIISHNEVRRDHPDRDKISGRIWRVRHHSQKDSPRVDLTKLSGKELLAGLGGDNARLANQMWQEIADRKATDLAGDLAAIATDSSQPLPRRTGALWALEGLNRVTAENLEALAQDPDANLRREAVRIAGEISLPEKDFLKVFSHLENEPDYLVRPAIANALRDHTQVTPAMIRIAAHLGLVPLEDGSRAAYDRSFERYLARWAMSIHAAATRAMLASESAKLPPEARLLAVRALDESEAALGMLEILPSIERALTPVELALLGRQLNQPEVQKGFANLLADPDRRETILSAMIKLDPALATGRELAGIVAEAIQAMLAEKRTPDREYLAVRLTRFFRLHELAQEVTTWLHSPDRSPLEIAEGLAALRESGEASADIFSLYLDDADDNVRREALLGFTAGSDPKVVADVATRWERLPGALRLLAVDGMTSNASKADAFATAIAAGDFVGVDAAAMEKLIAVLGDDNPVIAKLLESNADLLRPVIRFDGTPSGGIPSDISLAGPFTVEAWVRLSSPADKRDSLFGSPNADINFHNSKPRLHVDGKDIIISGKAVQVDRWTHISLTRDMDHNFNLLIDGKLEAKGGKFSGKLSGLNLGQSLAKGVTEGDFDEVRIWNIARTEEEIRRYHRIRFTEENKPAGLIQRINARAMDGLAAGAKIALTRDFPELVTPAESAALEQEFTKYRTLAEAPGDPVNGKRLAQATCLICHQVGDEGLAIGPDLSGAGAMGTEGLLRNILTPSAQLESGFFRHDLRLKNGSAISGFLTAEEEGSITIRQIGADERIIPRSEIIAHEISKRSLMPEGLLSGFTDQQVSDLFNYLGTLK